MNSFSDWKNDSRVGWATRTMVWALCALALVLGYADWRGLWLGPIAQVVAFSVLVANTGVIATMLKERCPHPKRVSWTTVVPESGLRAWLWAVLFPFGSVEIHGRRRSYHVTVNKLLCYRLGGWAVACIGIMEFLS